MTTKTLPPQVRRRINKMAHKLAQAAEVNIRDRLTAQAYDAAQSDSSPDAMFTALGLRALSDADLAAMSMTDAELLEWLKAHAWNMGRRGGNLANMGTATALYLFRIKTSEKWLMHALTPARRLPLVLR